MNRQPARIPVVIDTSSLVAILCPLTPYQKQLTKLWREKTIEPFATRETLRELSVQLNKTSPAMARQILRVYEPYCQLVNETIPPADLKCRDSKDQPFIDLAEHVQARYLITRDRDLLEVNAKPDFIIISDTRLVRLLSRNAGARPD